MIISASRRTDIPSFYSEWFFNRLRDGFVYVRNPMNHHQISRVSLSSDVVDGIVFWTKNPAPMLGRIDELRGYNYYFQFTLTPYGTDVERNLPSKRDVIIPTFKKLSTAVGKERVVWRYDPILINEHYSYQYHKKYFKKLCEDLRSYTEKCTVSFMDHYRSTDRNTKGLHILEPSYEDVVSLMSFFAETARNCGIYIDTCAEEYDLSSLGIPHASCIDKSRLERLGNCTLDLGKDKNQRGACCCIESIDIGAYNTCENGCVYCYANHNPKLTERNHACHDPSSPLLFGQVGEDDKVTERAVRSNAGHDRVSIHKDTNAFS